MISELASQFPAHFSASRRISASRAAGSGNFSASIVSMPKSFSVSTRISVITGATPPLS
jgi:hypothetical protein